MYNTYYDVPCVVLRFHHVCGARSNPELALSVFVEQALVGKTMEVHGVDGVSCSANYTHVDDAIRATLLAVDRYKGFDIYNIANKELTEVRYLAQQVAKRLASRSPIKNVPLLPHETRMHQSDVSKVEKELGFVATIPVEKAISDYIVWRLK